MLFGESVAPVAQPSLGVKSIRSAQALAKLTLLEYDDPQRPWLQWSDWLGAAGWSGARPQSLLRFNQYDQVIHAALAGQGVALGRLELIQPLLDEGRLVLVAPPRQKRDTMHAFWLVKADEHPRDDVRRVVDWIESEVQASRP